MGWYVLRRKKPPDGGSGASDCSGQPEPADGVDGVESFDETSIVMSTAEGSLIIRGESLHIEKLSLDGGDLLVEGTVDSLTYEEEEPRQGSFLGRLFRG